MPLPSNDEVLRLFAHLCWVGRIPSRALGALLSSVMASFMSVPYSNTILVATVPALSGQKG